ncbi:MAG: fumarylacetoacetate hydrolase family protein [Pyrinomonadaceae bacterium]
MKIEIEPDFSPSKIVCVGRNYADHAAELGNEVPKEPLLFLKAPSSLLLPKQSVEFGVRSAESENHETHRTSWPAIVIPPQSQQVEHEGELAVIIGKMCKNLSDSDDVNEYVRGYTCLNDVTARDLQKTDGQFARAKSFDTFCPIGPHIETELEVSDIRVITRLNGEIRQDGRTSQMVFGVEFLIRYISNMMTLLPGDVIATGTPSGVSKMNSGDVCEVEIEGIGTLRNSVR